MTRGTIAGPVRARRAQGDRPMAERVEIELFLQGEDIRDIVLIRVPNAGAVRDILTAARAAGLTAADGVELSLEDEESAIDLDVPIAATPISHRSRIHVHRCRKVTVKVTFNGIQKEETFRPAATVKRVKRWAVGKKGFDLSDVDAVEHVLQLSGSTERPDDDVHLGTLVTHPQCSASFDLVPKVRIEG
jgi:hypothetical protein